MNKRKKKNEFEVVKILKKDAQKIRKWALVRDMYMYEIINMIIEREDS